MAIYTKTGDKGSTSLLSGDRIAKNHAMVEAYGTLDELGTQIGVCRALATQELAETEAALLLELQRDLFRLGMQLSSSPDYWHKLKAPIGENDIAKLEKAIDTLNELWGMPNFFVAPGESLIGAALHVARAVCRRAERRIITATNERSGYELVSKYVNRLSDLLFALSWGLELRNGIIRELTC